MHNLSDITLLNLRNNASNATPYKYVHYKCTVITVNRTSVCIANYVHSINCRV